MRKPEKNLDHGLTRNSKEKFQNSKLRDRLADSHCADQTVVTDQKFATPLSTQVGLAY